MHAHQPLRRSIAALCVALLLAGCVSTRSLGRTELDDTGAQPGTGGVRVTTHESDHDRRAGVTGPRFVHAELDRREGKQWRTVFKALGPTWSVVDLPPGKYRLRYTSWLDQAGNAQRIDHPGRIFRIKPGKVSELQTTLEHFPTGLVVAGVVTAVVVAAILFDWLDDVDPPDLPLPSPRTAAAIFHLTLDLAILSDDLHHAAAERLDSAPVVTSHFPEEGTLVAARRIRIVFAFSEPLNPYDVEPQGITVVSQQHGLIAGRTTYDPEHWWLVWEADADFPAGDTFHVTLDPEAAEDQSGNELSQPVTFTFTTPGPAPASETR